MYTRRYRRRVTKRRPRYAGRKARVFRKKRTFAARVKKVLHSQIENKVITYPVANQTLSYAGPITNPYYANLTCIPTLGTNVQQRIGNQINVVKGQIKGFVRLLPYVAVSNPLNAPTYIKMWLCKRKSYNVGIGGLPGTTDFSNFFQSGSTSLGFQSSMIDMLLDVNKDYWSVLATKTIQLYSYSSGAAAGTLLVPGNASVSLPFSFSFGKHLGMEKFNDNTTYPVNKELFLVFQTVMADDTTPAGPYCKVDYVVQWEYEDA